MTRGECGSFPSSQLSFIHVKHLPKCTDHVDIRNNKRSSRDEKEYHFPTYPKKTVALLDGLRLGIAR